MVIYKQCYLPMVIYPLPATLIPLRNFISYKVQPLPFLKQKWGICTCSPKLLSISKWLRVPWVLSPWAQAGSVEVPLNSKLHSYQHKYRPSIPYHLTESPANGWSVPTSMARHPPLLCSSAHWLDNLWSFLHSINCQILILGAFDLGNNMTIISWMMPCLAYHLTKIANHSKSKVPIYTCKSFCCINSKP